MNTRQFTRPARWLACIAAALCIICSGASADEAASFTNPVLPSGPDPWVVRHDGFYYYTHTLGDRIALWKTRDLTRLDQVEPVTIWRARDTGPGSASLWAPELHRIDGKWYLYFTASDRSHDDDAHRHTFVLENTTNDPTKGTWTDKGMVNTQHSGIDSTIFRWHGQLYFVYSAYIGNHSDLIIARMKNPWTLSSKQIDIASPTHAWEMHGGRKILEGPEFLAGPRDKVFLTYSASACWSDDYALGLLTAPAEADLTDPDSWTKSSEPVFAKSPAHNVYAPGHNGFFTDTEGTHWIIYHANDGADLGCGRQRSPRIQPFDWKPDGTPDFGEPVSTRTSLPAPSHAGQP